MKRFLLFFLIFSFLIPAHCQGVENRVVEPPGTFKEVLTAFKDAAKGIVYAIPKGISLVWHKVMDPLTNFLENKVLPKIEAQINRVLEKVKNWFLAVIKPKLEKEIEERKPVIEEELEKEKEEFQQDTEKVKQSAWTSIKKWTTNLFNK